MTVRSVPFFSDRYLLDAEIHLPEGANAAAPCPVIVACSGFEGLKTIHPERFARVFTPRGYAVLAFDYRGFGFSEGERGRIVAQEWTEDVRAAIGILSTIPEIDTQRITLLGWGLGGGVVVAEAVDDPLVGAVVVANGIGDGLRSTRAMHTAESWDSLLERLRRDRGYRATHGRSELTSPWDIIRLGTGTPVGNYVTEELSRAPGFGSLVTLESADYLLRFSPELVVDRLSPRPLLIVHGQQNVLHRPEEAYELYRRATDPKRIEMLENAGHTEWMFDENPIFTHMIDMIDAFLKENALG